MGVYNFERPGNPQSYGFKDGDTILIGTFAVWDPTVTAKGQAGAYGAARPLSVGIGSSGAYFLGVFNGQQPTSSQINNSNPLEPINSIQVEREGVFRFNSTASETYVHGTAVYAAAAGDDQTITTVSGGNTLVGYVNLPLGGQITGATGITVPVELNANITKGSNAILSA